MSLSHLQGAIRETVSLAILEVNAQVQLERSDHHRRIYGRPVVGLFTNIFTLEPRRYGIAAGVSF